jgi:hypothetical protein
MPNFLCLRALGKQFMGDYLLSSLPLLYNSSERLHLHQVDGQWYLPIHFADRIDVPLGRTHMEFRYHTPDLDYRRLWVCVRVIVRSKERLMLSQCTITASQTSATSFTYSRYLGPCLTFILCPASSFMIHVAQARFAHRRKLTNLLLTCCSARVSFCSTNGHDCAMVRISVLRHGLTTD